MRIKSLIALLSLIAPFAAFAATPEAVVADTVIVVEEVIALPAETVTPAKKALEYENPKVRFAWGADAGASIDLTGNDMSAVDFNATFGMTRGWINFLGLGAGADISISNSTRSYPFFAEFRTNFREKPSVVFWDLRAGIAYNFLEHNHKQWGVYGNTGVGFNLARSTKFTSYLMMCYTFKQRRKVIGPMMTHDFRNLHFVSFRIGITF